SRDEERISAKKDGELSSSSSLEADLSSILVSQVKVRSRGSAEKARKTRSEKRSSSESGIHRDSAPSFTSLRRFFAKSDLCSDVSCSSLRPSRCPLFVVEGERKRSLKMRPGLRRATATRDEDQQEGGSNEAI
ncbi:hypothetical protein ALC53_10266, partial [Atta colombica]